MTFEPGLRLELEVQRVAHGGVFVAEGDPAVTGGRVVLVGDTAPGERVLAEVTGVHARFARADSLQVLRPAAARVPHVWPSAGIERPPERRAGGAEFGHLQPAEQRALKAAVLDDALRRTGRLPADQVDGLDVRVLPVPGEPDGTRSRTRVRLHVDGSGRVGPFAARSHTVVPVPDLPLAVAPLEALLRARAAPGPLELVQPGEGPAIALPAGADGTGTVHERVGERRFALAAGGFWQVHPAAPAVLADAVRRALGDAFDPAADNLDLYGGVGLLAAALADAGGPGTRVTTVEADRTASGYAARNLADLPRARAVAARTETFLARERPGRGGATVVLDPPRSGAGRAVVDAIDARRPARIVYVACDPVALARDAGRLAALGWRIERLEAFDLFPNTHHVEAVAAFRRA